MPTRRPAAIAAIGDPNALWSPRSVREVLGTRRLPNEIVGALVAWFRVTQEDGGALSSELRAGQGIHVFFGHLASGMDLFPGLERLNLLGFDQYGMVHLLH